ncbi:MAG: 50S ribosomal protein L34, partial [Parasporobacterium sp.]|nr:50S ribosomal protein L34 [Parasporobacterium sp.]
RKVLASRRLKGRKKLSA